MNDHSSFYGDILSVSHFVLACQTSLRVNRSCTFVKNRGHFVPISDCLPVNHSKVATTPFRHQKDTILKALVSP